MANISGNPVWKDYPDTTTLIDAEALNNLEVALNNAATTAEWGKITGVPTAFTPTAHAASHGEGGTDPVAPVDIGAVPDDDPRLYNSGWRELILVNGWTSNGAAGGPTAPAVLRVGNQVFLRTRNLNGSAATSDVFAELPPEFTPSSADGGLASFTGQVVPVQCYTNGFTYCTSRGLGAPGSVTWAVENPPAATPYSNPI